VLKIGRKAYALLEDVTGSKKLEMIIPKTIFLLQVLAVNIMKMGIFLVL
jgi:hypothetical protein